MIKKKDTRLQLGIRVFEVSSYGIFIRWLPKKFAVSLENGKCYFVMARNANDAVRHVIAYMKIGENVPPKTSPPSLPGQKPTSPPPNPPPTNARNRRAGTMVVEISKNQFSSLLARQIFGRGSMGRKNVLRNFRQNKRTKQD